MTQIILTLVPLHLLFWVFPSFLFFSFSFFFLCCITLYKFILYITRGVSNKAVEKDKIK